MDERRPVPVARRPRSGSRRAGARSARCGSPRRRSGWRRSPGRPGWAKTFGLPLELHLGRGGAGSSSRRCRPTACSAPRTCRPTATSTRASSRSRSPRARAGVARRSTRTRGSTGSRVRTGRVAAVETDRGRSRPRSSSTPAACTRARSARSPASIVPIVPMAHEYLVLEPSRPAARHADDARPVAARLLPAGVRRADHGRLRAALRAVVARRHPGGLQRQAARGGLAALRGADAERDRARARRSRRWRSSG